VRFSTVAPPEVTRPAEITIPSEPRNFVISDREEEQWEKQGEVIYPRDINTSYQKLLSTFIDSKQKAK